MRIEDLRTERKKNRSRIVATIVWEDSDRGRQDIYFETTDDFANGLTLGPHPFLLAGIMPALEYGEKRILIKEDICPELKENLMNAMRLIGHWYYGQGHEMIRLEGNCSEVPVLIHKRRNAGSFFSGGVDSYATLVQNRVSIPASHPSLIKDAFIVYGNNIESDNRPESFDRAFNELSLVLGRKGINLIPVYTNVRELEGDTRFFIEKYHGAILGAVAHAFEKRIEVMTIASSDYISDLHPHGSHPLLDPCYGSHNVRIRHDSTLFTRLEKVRLIKDWHDAINHLKVCEPNYPGENCCKCEKCTRTMLELLAVGLFKNNKSFLKKNITKKDILSSVKIKNTAVRGFYMELLEPLKAVGRDDLVSVINGLLRNDRKRSPIRRLLGPRIKRYDQVYFKGNLRKLVQSLNSFLA